MPPRPVRHLSQDLSCTRKILWIYPHLPPTPLPHPFYYSLNEKDKIVSHPVQYLNCTPSLTGSLLYKEDIVEIPSPPSSPSQDLFCTREILWRYPHLPHLPHRISPVQGRYCGDTLTSLIYLTGSLLYKEDIVEIPSPPSSTSQDLSCTRKILWRYPHLPHLPHRISPVQGRYCGDTLTSLIYLTGSLLYKGDIVEIPSPPSSTSQDLSCTREILWRYPHLPHLPHNIPRASRRYPPPPTYSFCVRRKS